MIVSGIICYSIFASELYFGLIHRTGIFSALVFFFLALYCTAWIGSYMNLKGVRYKGKNEESIERAEKRQALFLSLLGGATGMLIMCYCLFKGITDGYSVWYNVVSFVIALCFAYLVYINIQKRCQ